LIWPLLLWAAYRWRLNLATMITALLVGSLILMMQWPRTQAFYFLPSRFWELLLGGGLAYLERYHPGGMDAVLSRLLFQRNEADSVRILQHLKGVVAVGLLAWSGITLADDSTFPSWNALPPTLAAFLLISAGARSWVNRTILASAPAVFIGRISFPLYLWHWPLLSFARIIVGSTPPLETRVALVLLAVLLAWLTWRLVERPVQRRFPTSLLESTRYGGVRLVAASVMLLVILGGMGTAIDLSDGMPSSLRPGGLPADDGTPRQYYDYTAHMKVWTNFCDPHPVNWDSWCVSNNPAIVRFAIYGDSHAEHYRPSLLGSGTASDGWIFIGLSACPPVMNIDVHEGDIDKHCDRNNDWAQALLGGLQDIKTVVLSSLGTPYFNGSPRSEYSRDGIFRIESAVYKGELNDIYYRGLSDSVSKLLGAGKRVILMIDTPEMDFDVSRCAVVRPLRVLLARTKRVRCSVTREQYLRRNKEYRDILSKIKQANRDVLIYDPIDHFCDARTCNVFHNGRSMYRDGDHLSVYGSEVAGAYFLNWMMQQGIPLSKETQEYAASVR